MSEDDQLERAYRRWLRWYPRSFRAEHEEEMLGVLLASSPSGACALGPMDRLDLVRGGLGIRLRPRVPHSDRSTHLAVRLMLIGAVVELAVSLMVWATSGNLEANIVARNARYTPAQWHAEVTGRLEPLAIGAVASVAILLWMAWANGRGRGWAKGVFALLFGGTTVSLLHGLAQGSATYAREDLIAGLVLWTVEASAVVALAHGVLRRLLAAQALATEPRPPTMPPREDPF